MLRFVRTLAACAIVLAPLTQAAAAIISYNPPRLATGVGDPVCVSAGAGVTIKSRVKLLQKCYPGVPEDCWAAFKIRAEVRLLLDIDPTGFAQNIRIAATSYECLNDSTASAARQWKFKNDGAEMKDVIVTVRFVNHSDLMGRSQTFDTIKRN